MSVGLGRSPDKFIIGPMKEVYLTTRAQWRSWLSENHAREKDGVWLVFYKQQTGRPSLDYEDAVEEALCFGWIDSIIKRIDAERYCRKFTPRKDGSNWSALNKRRVAKVIREGRMTEFGLRKVAAARKSGRWDAETPRPAIDWSVPQELSDALARNRKAKAFFESLAPSYRKHFIAWIAMARNPVTKASRLKESIALLAREEKLGLK